MTKNEFEKGYIDRSGITQSFYDKYYITEPCYCGESCCAGWKASHREGVNYEKM